MRIANQAKTLPTGRPVGAFTPAVAAMAVASAVEAVARPHITVRGLRKSFEGKPVYAGFDLDIPRGKFISIFGPNGCGKSTLINLMAGLLPRDGGEILFDGRKAGEVRIGYVFQNYREALFPWLRARDNIAYPLKFMNIDKREQERRVEQLVTRLGIRIDLNIYPYQMSGGQQQLVSILRALVIEPEVLFLDEPFSALDYEMTLFMREQLQHMFKEVGATTLIVSHDLEEAVYLADEVLLLTRAPTQVAETVVVDCVRPRTDATLADPEFVRIKAHCLEIFQREVRR
jgi:NitT/TauT family transport system ATP-binding protein